MVTPCRSRRTRSSVLGVRSDPQAVIAEARPEFCITHAPGSMLITDLRNASLAAL